MHLCNKAELMLRRSGRDMLTGWIKISNGKCLELCDNSVGLPVSTNGNRHIFFDPWVSEIDLRGCWSLCIIRDKNEKPLNTNLYPDSIDLDKDKVSEAYK
jgi:hypothetical protein